MNKQEYKERQEKEDLDYNLVERNEHINDLINWISESTNKNDKELMKEDLEYLFSLKDKYILLSNLTNEYIAKSDNEGLYNSIVEFKNNWVNQE